MFEKLKQHWKVNGLSLVLIITTFALGGSLCGYAGRKLMALTAIDKGFLWVVLYILLITLLWPLAVLLVSIPFGQFNFFKKYIGKILGRFSSSQQKPLLELSSFPDRNPEGREIEENNADQFVINIAIFASGAGSNAAQIIQHFSSSAKIKIGLIVCNKPSAGVLNIAANAGIPSLLIEKEQFFKGDSYLPELQKHTIDFIVLAGFLWKIPEPLIKAYPKKIINIHPALLPKYGGKGMFGHYVHEAVINNKETESGITIHYVDELYDHGAVIFQATCTVDENDNADSLAKKIHLLEHTHYPKVIAETLQTGVDV
jgi:formyltetrahydrofolate-dependent phosphoribosylglycinamide formyltransferase